MKRKAKRPILRIVASNQSPVINRSRELDAIINRAIIINQNANASFYGDFTDADIKRWRNLK